MESLTKTRYATALFGGATIALAAAWTVRRLRQRYAYWNSPFVYCGTVKDLFVFPVKSTKPLEVDWVDCTSSGAEYGENKDRHFVFVDAKVNHLFLTARQCPKLVLIETFVNRGKLTLKTPNGREYVIELADVVARNDVRRAILWFDLSTDGLDCGDTVGSGIAQFLGVESKRDVRLLYFVQGLETERNLVPQSSYWVNPVPSLCDTPAYQDTATFNVTNQASIDDLNGRITDKVSARNFRPNINVEGEIPYDEDLWLHIRIGDSVEFACYRPCIRCTLITINTETGVFFDNIQPLRELRNYRLAPAGKLRDLYKQAPIFGVNMAMTKPGRIHRGDAVYVRRKPTPL